MPASAKASKATQLAIAAAAATTTVLSLRNTGGVLHPQQPYKRAQLAIVAKAEGEKRRKLFRAKNNERSYTNNVPVSYTHLTLPTIYSV